MAVKSQAGPEPPPARWAEGRARRRSGVEDGASRAGAPAARWENFSQHSGREWGWVMNDVKVLRGRCRTSDRTVRAPGGAPRLARGDGERSACSSPGPFPIGVCDNPRAGGRICSEAPMCRHPNDPNLQEIGQPWAEDTRVGLGAPCGCRKGIDSSPGGRQDQAGPSTRRRRTGSQRLGHTGHRPRGWGRRLRPGGLAARWAGACPGPRAAAAAPCRCAGEARGPCAPRWGGRGSGQRSDRR